MFNRVNRVVAVALAAGTMAFALSCKGDKKDDDETTSSLSVEPLYSAVVFSEDGATLETDEGTVIDRKFNVITKQADWEAKSNQEWLTVTENKQDNTFTLSAAVNESPVSPEPATVTVSAGTATDVSFAVMQKADLSGYPTALTNTERPFIAGDVNMCVAHHQSGRNDHRFVEGGWITNEQGRSTGSVIDRPGNNFDGLLFLASWDTPSWCTKEMVNGKLYQHIVLEAGWYEFVWTVYRADGGAKRCCVVAASGDDLPDIDNLIDFISGDLLEGLFPESVLACRKVSDDTYVNATDTNFSFVFNLTQRSLVSIGFVGDFLNGEAYFSKVELISSF